MIPSKNKIIIVILKLLPLMACAILAFLILMSGKEITFRTIIDYTPESPFMAAIVIMLLYALKSVSFVFPIAALQIATGHLFQMPTALLINFLGRAVALSIPYWIGRFSGSELVERLQIKYPKLKELCSRQGQSPIFISFLLRTFCFLPGDAVSLYLGAIKIPFPYYLAGGVLGTVLGVVLSTTFGSSITEPDSPLFWISALLMSLMAIISFIFYLNNRRKGVAGKTS